MAQLQLDELALILTTRLDQLQKGLDRATELVNKQAGKTQDANKKTEQSFSGAANAVGLMSAGLVTFVGLAAKGAAQAQALATAVDAVAKMQGISKAQTDETVNSLKAMGFTTREALEATSRLLRAQVDLAKATKLAQVAQDLAAVSGKDDGDTMNDLAQAVATGNTRLLRQYGILINTDKIFKELARTLKVGVDELTDAEKQNAVFNALMEKGQVISGAWAAAMADGSIQVREIKDEISEASDNIGKAFLPLLKQVVGAAFNLLQRFNNLSPATQTLISWIIGGTAALAGFLGILGFVLTKVAALAAAVKVLWLAIAASPVGIAIAALAALTVALEAFFSVWEKKVEQANQKAIEQNRIINAGGRVTTSQIAQMTDPREAQKAAEARLLFLDQEIAENRKLTQEQRIRLEMEERELKFLKGSIDIAVQKLPIQEKEKKNSSELAEIEARRVRGLEVAKKAMEEVAKKMEKEAELNGLNEQQRIDALKRYMEETRLSAAERIALEQIISDKELELAIKVATKKRALNTQLREEMSAAFAAAVAAEVDVFNLQAFNMEKIFQDMVNKMVRMLIESSILDFLSFIFTGSGKGLVGGLLGFDEPANDNRMKGMGMKWFNDALRNFSDGFVHTAQTNSQTGPVFAAATMNAQNAQPSNTSLSMNYAPTVGFGSPSEMRRAMVEFFTMAKREGFSV